MLRIVWLDEINMDAFCFNLSIKIPLIYLGGIITADTYGLTAEINDLC